MTGSTFADRAVAVADAWAARVRRRGIDATLALWELLGSAQVRNLLLAIAVLLAMHVARRVERSEAALARIAEAQGVMGYATMRQLDALGLSPTLQPAAADERRAIDPEALQHDAAARDRIAGIPAAASAAHGSGTDRTVDVVPTRLAHAPASGGGNDSPAARGPTTTAAPSPSPSLSPSSTAGAP